MALDGSLEEDVRENLTRSHAASRTLIHVINDLLVRIHHFMVFSSQLILFSIQDLTRTERGNELFLQDPFDLPSSINDAVAIHRAEALRRGLTLEVTENPQGTPSIVLGDRGKVKNIIANVVANAVKHTDIGGISIEWGELVDGDIEDALNHKKDSIRIGISM